MLAAVLWFAVGLVLLIKGGDWFVDGATGIARRFHLPELLIGATVVSIGTTLPEVMVSTTSRSARSFATQHLYQPSQSRPCPARSIRRL